MNTDLLIGVFLIIFYIARSAEKTSLLKNGIPTKAIVLDLSLEQDGNRISLYYPIIRYALKDGTWITEKYSDGTKPASFKKGDEVDILYDLNNPSSFIIINNKIEHLDKIFLIVGLLASIYSAYQMVNN